MTGNQSIVSALSSLGFGFSDEDSPCTNSYSKDEPIARDRDNRPIKPGNVRFMLNRESDVFVVNLKDVLDEWRSGQSDKELDNLIQPGADDSVEVAKLKREIMDVLPLALTQYMKGVLKNRKEVAGMFRQVNPMRAWKEGGSTFLITDNLNQKAREDLGC